MRILRKALSAILSLALLTTMLTGCSRASATGQAPDIAPSYKQFAYGVMGETEYFVTEDGLLYMKDGLIRFYDFEADASYVLCGNPDCWHSDMSCAAWYQGAPPAAGLALYGQNVYVIKWEIDLFGITSIQLVRIDLESLTPQVVCSLDGVLQGTSPNSIPGISFACYSDGKAWIASDNGFTIYPVPGVGPSPTAGYMYNDGPYNIFGIDLESGEITELLDPAAERFVQHQIRLAADGYIVLERQWNPDPLLFEQEFNEALQRGEFAGFASAEVPYFEYVSWYYENASRYSVSLLDLATGASELLVEGDCTLQTFIEYESGAPTYGYLAGRLYQGCYAGSLIYSIDNYRAESYDSQWYSYDLQTGEESYLLEMTNGYLEYVQLGGDMVTDDGYIIYNQRQQRDDDSRQVYRYSLPTGESEALFTAGEHTSIYIYGETADSFIGRVWDVSNNYFEIIIAKDDYYKGDVTAYRVFTL